jgi:hypothetical protein
MSLSKLIRICLAISFSVLWALNPKAEKLAYADTQDSHLIHIPGEAADLSAAVNLVADGGVIEYAGGTYNVPSGGFILNNLNKGFTVRAAPGQQVTLSGGGTKLLIRLQNTSLSQGRPIIFENLTFANGYSNTPGLAGGISIYSAKVTFIGCTFSNNSAGGSTSGGGLMITSDSTVFFFSSMWIQNRAVVSGAGMAIGSNSKVYIHDSQFTGNRTNFPGHSPYAAGGAIHLGDSVLRISNTRFENNQAGYVGGAIFAIGTWTSNPSIPHSDVIVSNSTFINNQAARDPGISLNVPTEGGAFHVEAQTTAKIYNSRFITNSAMAGGALSNYQAILEIENSVFLGNAAVGSGSLGGYGGAIGAGSNDTPANGNTNMRSASVTLRNSYIQGRYAGVSTVGYGGGGIMINGDVTRMYGLGVSQMGTAATNRATLVIDRVVFNDLDVYQNPVQGMGGALLLDLVDLDMQNSMIIDSDASGNGLGAGGGLAVIDNSLANISNSIFARNTATLSGGGIFVQGATINIQGSTFLKNEVSPGINENVNSSCGAALFSAPGNFYGQVLNVDGEVKSSNFVEDVGLSIVDDDYAAGPINSVVYNQNQFYEPTYGDKVYRNPLASVLNSAGLNNLVVNRNGGLPSTAKAPQSNNHASSSEPIIAEIVSNPIMVLPTNAWGDPPTPTTAYLAYVWNGSSANLNGVPLATQSGAQSTTSYGSYTISVGQNSDTAEIYPGVSPVFSVSLNAGGANPVFSWSLIQGTFIESVMDQGVTITSASSGSVQLPTPDHIYYFYAITKEGGFLVSTTPQTLQIFLPLVKK